MERATSSQTENIKKIKNGMNYTNLEMLNLDQCSKTQKTLTSTWDQSEHVWVEEIAPKLGQNEFLEYLAKYSPSYKNLILGVFNRMPTLPL